MRQRSTVYLVVMIPFLLTMEACYASPSSYFSDPKSQYVVPAGGASSKYPRYNYPYLVLGQSINPWTAINRRYRYCCSVYIDYGKLTTMTPTTPIAGGIVPDPATNSSNSSKQSCPAGTVLVGNTAPNQTPNIYCAPVRQRCEWVDYSNPYTANVNMAASVYAPSLFTTLTGNKAYAFTHFQYPYNNASPEAAANFSYLFNQGGANNCMTP